MKCDRCGRDNPPNLRFCQDCGNRLQAPPPRAVEPTPPRGVAIANAEHIRARPPAPDFDFSPRGAAPGDTNCSRCGVPNPAGARFCAECGANIDGDDAVTVAQAPELDSPAPPRPPVPPGPMVAAPVVNLAPAASHEPAPVACPRCRGSNLPHMAFCQYCGARIGEAPGGREPPATSPESPLSGKAGPARPPPPSSRPPPPRPDPQPALPAMPAPPAAAVPVAAPLAQPVPEPARGRLIVVAQDGSPGRDYPLSTTQTDIGRTEGSIQLPNDPYVSPRHARISRREGRFFIRDLGSLNGVYVRLRGPIKLRHGDLVLIGLEVLRFEVVSESDKGLGPASEGDTQVFGSPMLPRFARLCQRTVEGVTRDVYYIAKDEVVIGREAGDIVFTSDPFMSRRHAAVTREHDGGFALRDLGSSNGTYIAIHEEFSLSDGDHVRVGQHLFRLDQGRGQG